MHNKGGQVQKTVSVVIESLVALVVVVVLWHLALGAFDGNIDSQNVMLCNSAKTEMGDPDYFKKCQQYYETGDINYMR